MAGFRLPRGFSTEHELARSRYLLHVTKLTVLLVALSTGCGTPTQTVTFAPPRSTSTTAPVTVAASTMPFACTTPDTRRITSHRSEPVGPAPVPGQMTEAAAMAMRLYNAEQWREADPALARIVSGETGDDLGNRQIAEYRRAAALYRTGRYADAYAMFRGMALGRDHLKHGEALLWLNKLVDVAPQVVDLEVFSAYTRDDVEHFHNEPQIELYYELSFLLGRERMLEANAQEARELFGHIPKGHRLATAVERCIASMVV